MKHCVAYLRQQSYLLPLANENVLSQQATITLIATNPCNLHTPVQQYSRVDVGLFFADIISKAAEPHQLGDDHHPLCHADRQDSDTVLVVH